MNCSQLVESLRLLAGLSAALLAVCVTLVALIPTLLQVARVNAPDVFSLMDREGVLKRIMLALAVTVLLFSISLASSWIGIFFAGELWFWTGLSSFGISLVILLGVSLLIAKTARDVM